MSINACVSSVKVIYNENVNKITFEADRWFLGAYSPNNFEELPDAESVAVIHPGWARHPKHYSSLMQALANQDIFPITVDTRYGYANQQEITQRGSSSLWQKLHSQSYKVGIHNPYFSGTTEKDNRGSLRKPTATLAICEALGIEKFSMLGHSDGGRTATVVAQTAPEHVQSLTLINAVGTGKTHTIRSYLASRGLRQIAQERLGLLNEGISTHDLVMGGLSSALYAVRHPRRIISEHATIRLADTWPVLGQLTEQIPVNVLQAKDDALINFTDASEKAGEYPDINFIPTEGGHGNIYHGRIQQIIAGLIS